MEIIIGLAMLAGLFFLVAMLFQRGDKITGPLAFLIFSGFGIFTMNIMSSAIYTEWNNSATYNSSMTVPETMMIVSFWSVYVWVLIIILGILFWIIEWYRTYRVGKK